MPDRLHRLAWLMWALGALFYAYGFFQRVAPSVMVEELMAEFVMGGAMLGSLSAAYFYAYAAVQIPVGVLLDRLGPKRLLTGAALLAAAGGLAFATASSFGTAVAGRVLVGLGGGFAYISTLKIASAWFPPNRFGLVAGLTLTAGTCGAMGAQVPLAALIAAFGWRPTMALVAVLGLVLALLMAVLLRDRPAAAGSAGIVSPGLADGLRRVMAQKQTWLLAAVTGLVGAPVLTFAGLWGVPYLVQAEGLSRTEAGLVTSAMLAAWAVGGPLCGWLSDRLGRRRPVLLGGSIAMGLLWLPVVLWPSLPVAGEIACFVLVGLAAGCMVVAFAAARDRFGSALAGSALGVVNSSVLLFGAAMQTVVGMVLDLRWAGALSAGARVYDEGAYRLAFLVFLLAAGLATAAALALGERRPARGAQSPL
jgi:MFS family permease